MTTFYATDETGSPDGARRRLARRSWRACAVGIALVSTALACGGSPTAPSGPSTPPPPAAPSLQCQDDVTLQSLDGLPVAFTPTPPSVQGGSQPVSVSCDAPATFPIGTTSVTCTGTDASARQASCTFIVTIDPPPVLAFTRFVAFGDSLTAGEVSPAPGLLFLSPNDAYPFRLENLLLARYPDQRITVENAGEPGEFLTFKGFQGQPSGLERLAGELRSRRPEVLLLMEGTNDLRHAQPEDVIAGLDDAIREARQRGIRVLLATLPPQRPGGIRDRVAKMIPGFNDMVRTLAVQEGVPLVDVYAAMADDLSLIGQDDLHPTALGYQVIAETWHQVIIDELETVSALPTLPSPTVPSLWWSRWPR
jgi:lysophospholipase L1-like esterase